MRDGPPFLKLLNYALLRPLGTRTFSPFSTLKPVRVALPVVGSTNITFET